MRVIDTNKQLFHEITYSFIILSINYFVYYTTLTIKYDLAWAWT